MISKARHYLYPLNPGQGYVFERRGQDLPTSRSNFFRTLDFRKLDEWGIVHNALKLEVNDFIWVHFALPDSAIYAVGQVAKTATWKEDWGKYAIKIRWNKQLTERLKRQPIPLSAHGQVPYSGVTAANERTTKILDKWLKGKVPQSTQKRDEQVKFRKALVDRRTGQPLFRGELMRAYNNKCAISGCAIDEVLQAAHIRPVRASGRHSLSNGLLLRADIHNLFDRGLITIDPSYVIRLDESIQRTPEYKSFHNRILKVIPKDPGDRPSKSLLAEHRRLFSKPLD
jgi:hypothetical protein